MQWYLLKTWKGREEELVKEIHRTVPAYMYENVFVIYTERIWRRQGRSIVHAEPLFHGCAFLTCKEPGPLWRRLERVPFLAQWMAAGYLSVYPLMERDAEFLRRIAGDDHVMRLSYVLRERDVWPNGASGLFGMEGLSENAPSGANLSTASGQEDMNKTFHHEPGSIRYRVSGPLEYCLEDIDNIEFRKRFVKLHKRLWGEDLVIAMGIVLNEDVEQGIVYEGLKTDAEIPNAWTILEIGMDAAGKRRYSSGERIFPAKATTYLVDGETCEKDNMLYPADSAIAVLPRGYGEIAQVG